MTNNTDGIGFFGLLTIVLIVLKLTGYITLSWFWVLFPLIISIILGIIIVILILFYVILK